MQQETVSVTRRSSQAGGLLICAIMLKLTEIHFQTLQRLLQKNFFYLAVWMVSAFISVSYLMHSVINIFSCFIHHKSISFSRDFLYCIQRGRNHRPTLVSRTKLIQWDIPDNCSIQNLILALVFHLFMFKVQTVYPKIRVKQSCKI